MSKTLAKDVLGELGLRRSLGDRLTARVGRRAWERARVAVSSRIFRIYRIADPWDPNSVEDDFGLGPVSQRLSESKRQPAPHAQPKDTGPKKVAAPASAAPRPTTKPASDSPKATAQPPRPPESRPPVKPPPKATDAPPSAPPPRSDSGAASEGMRTSGAFGYIPKQYEPKKTSANSGFQNAASPRPQPPKPAPAKTASKSSMFQPKEAPGLVGRLPVRPDAKVPEGAAPQAQPQRSGPAVSPPQRVAPPTPVAPVRPSGGSSAGRRAGRVSLGPAVVVSAGADSVDMELEVEEIAPPRAKVTARAVSASSSASSEASSAPSPAPRAVVDAPAEAAPRPAPRSVFVDDVPAPKTPPPPRRSLPTPGKGDDLDDLFAASMNEGRMRIGKPKQKVRELEETKLVVDAGPEEEPKKG